MELRKVQYVGWVRPRPGWATGAHRHDWWHELILVLGGRIETQICGQVLTGVPGDVLFYPRGEVHAERAVGRQMLETFYVGFWGPDIRDWPLKRHDSTARIRAMMPRMGELGCGGPRDYEMLPVFLEVLLYEYGSPAADPEPDHVDRAKLYAQEHLADPLTLEDLAAACGFSRYHFAHLFRQSTGISPMRYVRELRVEHARALLTTTDWPLKTIAARTGFADLRQLCRVFKNVTGMPPGEVRSGGVSESAKATAASGRGWKRERY